MAFKELKRRLDEIFSSSVLQLAEMDLDFKEHEEKLLKFKDPQIEQPRKKSKLFNSMDLESCPNKTYNIVEAVCINELNNPTPVSTKMYIKNIIKVNENSPIQDPVSRFKKKLDVRKIQDESSFFFNKAPGLIPLVTSRKHIHFDDLDTDDEEPKGRYPKWSFPRYYRRKLKEQVHVNSNLVETFFSCQSLQTAIVLSIFPSTSPINFVRNESSIWEAEQL